MHLGDSEQADPVGKTSLVKSALLFSSSSSKIDKIQNQFVKKNLFKSFQDYPAGGSGMIFHHKLVEQMVDFETNSFCKCPSPDSYDDAHIGLCLKQLGVPVTHTDRLHQGRPG